MLGRDILHLAVPAELGEESQVLQARDVLGLVRRRAAPHHHARGQLKQLQQNVQGAHFNRQGIARTSDYTFLPPDAPLHPQQKNAAAVHIRDGLQSASSRLQTQPWAVLCVAVDQSVPVLRVVTMH